MYRIIFSQEGGGISVVTPGPGLKLEEIAARTVPPMTAYEVVETAALPADRYFRNAWKRDGTRVSVDMVEARRIQMNHLRGARDRELRRLDAEQLRGRDVAVEKQRLRDLPQTFVLTAATTPEDLKALWPENLPR